MSNRSWKKVILGSIFLVLSIFYTVIFFQHAAFGNEMIFNIAHIKSLTNIFVSPINFDYWNHSGGQVNLYSPWLTILPGILFLNGNVAYGFSFLLTVITFLTLTSAYFYMNKFSKNTLESLLFSVIYTFSLNRFQQVFQDQRLENYLVLIFLPMVYYGAFQIFSGEFKHWLNLACGMSLIVWTAPYMALSVSLTLIPMAVLMLFSKVSHSWTYWGHLLINIGEVIGLSALMTVGFWGPLIENQLQNKFVQNPVANLDYFKWFQNLNLSNVQQYLLIAIAVLLLVLLIFIFFQNSFAYKLLMIEIIPLSIAMVVKFKITGIDLSRLVLSLQSILELFVIIIVTRIIIMLFQEAPIIFRLVIVTATMIGLCFLVYAQANQIKPQQTLIASNKINYSNVVTNYHDSAKSEHNHFSVNQRNAKVSFYTKNSDYWIQYYNPQAATMDLPIQNYSGYRVELNNESVKTKTSDHGTVMLQTNPGKNIIEVHAYYTWIGIASLIINLMGFILLIYISISKGYWINKKSSYI